MTEDECSTTLQGCLLGLEHMHTRGHIHRDIKAGNVLLGRDCLAKLADFGVAGKVSEANQKRKTVIGASFCVCLFCRLRAFESFLDAAF